MNVTVCAVQLDSVWENKPENYAKARALLHAAGPAAGSLIVLPEMFATGFSSNLAVTAEPEGGPTQIFLAELAQQHQCCVIGGLVTHGSGGKGRNQALAVAPDGSVLHRYTKVRPFSHGGEGGVHECGADVQVFEWQGLRIAPMICYDLRFPELARAATGQGAEVLIYIAAWPVRRIQHWLTLLMARAIENQACVIGVNRCGTEPQFSYNGRSVIVDPHGIIIADASEHERVIQADIEPEMIRGWRAQFPALQDAGLQ